MTEDLFLGREEQLEILRKRVSGLREGYRQNIALIGDELAGKSTLIYHFLRNLYDPHIITLYLEAKDETRSSFVKRFIAVLLYNFLTPSTGDLREDLGYLVDKARPFIPKTVERIEYLLQISQGRKRHSCFEELLNLTALIHQETGKFSLVIFDEFHNLESLGFADFYRGWCNVLMAQKTTMYVIVSSMKFRAQEILSKNLSLLFGNFEVVTIEPFDIKLTEDYLEQALTGKELSPGLKNFIVRFTGGYPLYMKVVTNAFRNRDVSEFPAVLEDLLFDTSGILHQRFSNYIKMFQGIPNKKDYLCILHMIASGSNKINDLVRLLHKPRKDILARINYLLSLDTVTRSGDFLMINDRVFSFWLRFVYDEKFQALTFDARAQKAHFREAVSKMVDDFSLSVHKPLTERMVELMNGFENEMLQIERKRFRLNQFREVKPLEFENERVKEGIIGRCQDCLWIMAVMNSPLTEEDVTVFARECKKHRHKKQQRRIIVSVYDQIDTNTRLRALEEKIWTWDINRLNYVFDLFHKPAVSSGADAVIPGEGIIL